MSYVAAIHFERKQLPDLHAWLDTFAPGWAYYNNIGKFANTPARNAQLRQANEDFCQQNIDRGTGHLTSFITVYLADGKAAMAARIAWKDISLRELDAIDDKVG